MTAVMVYRPATHGDTTRSGTERGAWQTEAEGKAVWTGTHRVVAEAETLERLRPSLRRWGITRVANITGLDDIGIPTVLATRPNSRSLSVSQGKGLSLDAARVSAIMESIEQAHAEEVQLPLRLGSYHERVRVGAVVDPTRLPRYLHAFHPDTRLLWVEAHRYPSGEPCEVPFEMVHLDLRVPLPPGSGYFPLGSNGLASGNSFLEAASHAVWELIERDAVALFYQRSPEEQATRRVRLNTIDDACCLELLRRYETAGVGVCLWDITSDVGVAAFFCSIVERDLDPFRRVGIARGFGCHTDRSVALCRALTEAAQSRLTRITGSRDDIQAEDFESIRSRHAIEYGQRSLEEEAFAHHSYQAVPSHRFDSFRADLDWTAECLRAAGMGEVLLVDLSHHEEPLYVARAIVPGLEGVSDTPGYVPGPRALAIHKRRRPS